MPLLSVLESMVLLLLALESMALLLSVPESLVPLLLALALQNLDLKLQVDL